jgi:HAD superfamily hydrolase (TIGR01509 family)
VTAGDPGADNDRGVSGGLAAVLFDMDGLLVDTEPLWNEVERRVMARLGGSWGPADQEQLVGGPLSRTLGYMLGKAHRPVAPEVAAGWMTSGLIDLIREREVALLPGAARLLAEVTAAGVPHALVTSSERVVMEAVLEAAGVTFPVRVCAADVSRTKPDPEPYLLAAKLLGVIPERCVVLEDSPNGVAAAEAAGCAVIAVPNVTPIAPGPRRAVVESLRDVSVGTMRALLAADQRD